MKTQTKTLIFSCLAHSAFLGCAFALNPQAIPEKAPVVIDFTLQQAPFPTQAAAPAGEENGARQTVPHEDVAVEKTIPEPPREIVEKSVVKEKRVIATKKTPVTRKITKKPAEEPAPVETPPPAPDESSEPASATADTAPHGEGELNNSAPPQAATGHGGLDAGKAAATAGGQYLQKNYAYIRKHIMDHLIYPATAQRMGMRGKVLVSFIINEGGDVDDVTIVTSCGHELLDTNVINTIHKAAPFPKPPEKAQIILPIVYDLKSS